MNIEVKTAVEGCANYCPHFEIEITSLYRDDKIFYKTYRCINYGKCQAMLLALSRANVKKNKIGV